MEYQPVGQDPGQNTSPLDDAGKRAKYSAGPTTIRFHDGRGDDPRPTEELDVGVPIDLVLEATWCGDDIELFLGSTSKAIQSETMYHQFFENYTLDFAFAKRTDFDGLNQAMWRFELDAAISGEEEIRKQIAELIRRHNDEILRIRQNRMHDKSD